MMHHSHSYSWSCAGFAAFWKLSVVRLASVQTLILKITLCFLRKQIIFYIYKSDQTGGVLYFKLSNHDIHQNKQPKRSESASPGKQNLTRCLSAWSLQTKWCNQQEVLFHWSGHLQGGNGSNTAAPSLVGAHHMLWYTDKLTYLFRRCLCRKKITHCRLWFHPLSTNSAAVRAAPQH